MTDIDSMAEFTSAVVHGNSTTATFYSKKQRYATREGLKDYVLKRL
jgi:hypothetical protein